MSKKNYGLKFLSSKKEESFRTNDDDYETFYDDEDYDYDDDVDYEEDYDYDCLNNSENDYNDEEDYENDYDYDYDDDEDYENDYDYDDCDSNNSSSLVESAAKLVSDVSKLIRSFFRKK